MRVIKQGIVFALLGMLPGWAAADGGASSTAISESSFATLDADHSGALNREELKAYPALEKAFDSADANADGKLSSAEFSALLAKSKEGAM